MWLAIADIALSAGAPSGPLATLLLVFIAAALVMVAAGLFRRPVPMVNRRCNEFVIVITVASAGHVETFSAVAQARPGNTRTELLAQARGDLPEELRGAPIVFWSVEPNLLSDRPARIGARPAKLSPLQSMRLEETITVR
jgi:hypothetical protein